MLSVSNPFSLALLALSTAFVRAQQPNGKFGLRINPALKSDSVFAYTAVSGTYPANLRDNLDDGGLVTMMGQAYEEMMNNFNQDKSNNAFNGAVLEPPSTLTAIVDDNKIYFASSTQTLPLYFTTQHAINPGPVRVDDPPKKRIRANFNACQLMSRSPLGRRSQALCGFPLALQAFYEAVPEEYESFRGRIITYQGGTVNKVIDPCGTGSTLGFAGLGNWGCNKLVADSFLVVVPPGFAATDTIGANQPEDDPTQPCIA